MADDLENLQIPDDDYAEAVARLIERARYDFFTYMLLFNPPDSSSIVWGRLHEYLASKVQGVADGTLKPRQIVSVPPQHGKSTVLSKEAASWILGRFPTKQLAITSYSSDLVTDFSKAIRDRLSTPLYQKIFPETTIKEGENTQDTWALTKGGSLRGRSTGSKLTGRRVDYLIIDDPHAGREEAESPLQRKRVRDWYYADCYTRLAPDAAVFIIATRWHPEDLIGELTGDEKVKELEISGHQKEIFEITNLPAIAEQDDALGRQEGEALFPEVRDLSFLLAIKHNLPSYEWDSQYQQHPRAGQSNQADTDKIVYINEDEVPTDIEKVRYWDFALTEKQRSDYTAGPVVAYDFRQTIFYIIDMFRNRKPWVFNRKCAIEVAEEDRIKWNVQRIGIEAVAGFGIAFQDLHNALLGEIKVEAHNPPAGGKLARAQPWLNRMEAGQVRVVRGPWNKDFIAELQGFPAGDHDDQVDGVSGGWEMLTGRNRLGLNDQKKGNRRPSSRNRPSSRQRPTIASQ